MQFKFSLYIQGARPSQEQRYWGHVADITCGDLTRFHTKQGCYQLLMSADSAETVDSMLAESRHNTVP